MPNTSVHWHVINIFAVVDVMFSCHPKADKKSFRLAVWCFTSQTLRFQSAAFEPHSNLWVFTVSCQIHGSVLGRAECSHRLSAAVMLFHWLFFLPLMFVLSLKSAERLKIRLVRLLSGDRLLLHFITQCQCFLTKKKVWNCGLCFLIFISERTVYFSVRTDCCGQQMPFCG